LRRKFWAVALLLAPRLVFPSDRYHVAQEIITASNAGEATPAERWLISSVEGAKVVTLYRTEPRHLSADRCPPPTARWQRVAQRKDAADVDCDMVVLAQWCDDVTYTRRNADYSAVNCVDSNCKMDVGGPNSGDNKAVHFGEDNNSDSVPRLAILRSLSR
jgi:hypothetical protein